MRRMELSFVVRPGVDEVMVNVQHVFHRIIRKVVFTLRDHMVPRSQNTALADSSWIGCLLSSLFIWSERIPKMGCCP